MGVGTWNNSSRTACERWRALTGAWCGSYHGCGCALRRSLAWPRRNAPMNVSRNRLPFALLVVVMIGAGITLLAAQFVALGEVHAAHSALAARGERVVGLASSASFAHATSSAFGASTTDTAVTSFSAQRGADNPILAKAYRF